MSNETSVSAPISPELLHRLFESAREVATRAYAPYSNFHVGAALLTKEGRIITGCNVENSSFGVTICAERTAATRAVASGLREWTAIAIVSPTGVSPCGACRQFLAEFAPNLSVWFGHLDPEKPTVGPISLEVLLPAAMKFPS